MQQGTAFKPVYGSARPARTAPANPRRSHNRLRRPPSLRDHRYREIRPLDLSATIDSPIAFGSALLDQIPHLTLRFAIRS